MKQNHLRIFVGALLALAAVSAWAGHPLVSLDQLAGLSLMAGVGSIELVTKALDNIEKQLDAFATKADIEAKIGSVSADTKAAIEGLGTQQRELADRLIQIEQRATQQNSGGGNKPDTWGSQFIGCDTFKATQSAIASGRQFGSIGFEVKNTVVTSDTTVAPDRKPYVVSGAFLPMRIEELLSSLPTSSNAIEYTRENVFTNSAAEATEGNALVESSLTFALDNIPVQSVGHFIKISRQLAADNAALAAYINTRMRYGVDLKVEYQLYAGTGVAPQLSGLNKSGNYTAHGYTAAALTGAGLSATNRFDLIGKVIGDCYAAGFPANGILLNPSDWWIMRLTKDTTGRYLLGDPGVNQMPMLFGLPVAPSVAVTADTFQLGAYNMAATVHNREGVVVELSDSDTDNFQKQLVTVRATRRLALAVERPASIRGGDLTPA
jgi:HK97 family phage major capsid protein